MIQDCKKDCVNRGRCDQCCRYPYNPSGSQNAIDLYQSKEDARYLRWKLTKHPKKLVKEVNNDDGVSKLEQLKYIIDKLGKTEEDIRILPSMAIQVIDFESIEDMYSHFKELGIDIELPFMPERPISLHIHKITRDLLSQYQQHQIELGYLLRSSNDTIVDLLKSSCPLSKGNVCNKYSIIKDILEER